MRLELFLIPICSLLFVFNTSYADKLGDSVQASKPHVSITLTKATRRSGIVTVKADGKKEKYDCAHIGRIENSYLLDPESGTKYMLLKDEKEEAIGMNGSGECEKFTMYGKFPAPPKEVKSVDIIFDGFQPFENVTLTDE